MILNQSIYRCGGTEDKTDSPSYLVRIRGVGADFHFAMAKVGFLFCNGPIDRDLVGEYKGASVRLSLVAGLSGYSFRNGNGILCGMGLFDFNAVGAGITLDKIIIEKF